MIDAVPSGDPPSPCNKVCSLDRRTGRCLGCHRTAAEIGAWPRLNAAEKRALLSELDRRRRAGTSS